jgi:hypothetical protein
MDAKGNCTLFVPENKEFAIGFFLPTDTNFLTKLYLFPSTNPPNLHRCTLEKPKFFNLKLTSRLGEFMVCNIVMKNPEADNFQFSSDTRDVCGKSVSSEKVEFIPYEIKVRNEAQEYQKYFSKAAEEYEDYYILLGKLTVSIDKEI